MKRAFHSAVKWAVRFGLSTLPRRIYERVVARDVIGLCYHLVTDDYPSHAAHISSYKSTAQFEADLQYLTKHYQVVSYGELIERRAESLEQRARINDSTCPAPRSPLPAPRFRRPAAIVTFDDGYRECFDVVRPLLLKYDVPAIFFLTTDFIDNKRLFFRNKVSLCVDHVQNHSDDVGRQGSRAVADLLGLVSGNARAICDALFRLKQRDEDKIDGICQMLGVDTDLFLQKRRPYLTTAQIQQLSEEGFMIGAHGVTHTPLSDLLGTVQRAESEGPGAKSPETRAEGREEGPGEGGSGRTVGQASTQHPAYGIQHPTTVSSPPLGTRHSAPAPRPLTAFDSEVVESCRRIGEITGAASVPFAFPFGTSNIPLDLIAKVYEEHAEVGLMFDSRGLLPGPYCLVQRISSDDSDRKDERHSSLPRLISQEYQIQLRRNWIEPIKRRLARAG